MDLKQLNRKELNLSHFTERAIQFGGGNFLRAFLDWIIDKYNKKFDADLGILVIKTTAKGNYYDWQNQDGLYHILTKGVENKENIDRYELIASVSRIIHLKEDWNLYLDSAKNPNIRYIFSNTTEAGIQFSAEDLSIENPKEFPAKLLAWLYQRYLHFKGDPNKGCIIIPTELIIDNGQKLQTVLKKYAQIWTLENDFVEWLDTANIYCDTLVDRIVPGLTKNERSDAWKKIGYQDFMMTQAEPYHLFVITAPKTVREELPIDQMGLNILYTNDLEYFRKRKVSILNGAHTAMVPIGYLSGIETVGQSMEDPKVGLFIKHIIFNEIIPSLLDNKSENIQYANAILDRFRNPFVEHRLLSISLNALSKFRTRVLPSILNYQAEFRSLPKGLVLSMASLLSFYKGKLGSSDIPLNDNDSFIQFLKRLWSDVGNIDVDAIKLAKRFLEWKDLWGQDLSSINGLTKQLTEYLIMIQHGKMEQAIDSVLTDQD